MAQRDELPGEDLTRRRFLRSAAVAGGLALAGPRIVRAEVRRAEPLHVALVGAGIQGRRLLMDCLKIGGVRFQAVCDVWERNRMYGARLLRKYKHPARDYEDDRDMLAAEKDLDAVLIATPDWVHAPQTIRALQGGLHVYCEKEMSNDLAQAREMVLAARRTGKRLQIGHQRRSNPRYHQVLDYIDRRRVCGRITYVFAQWNRGKYLTRSVNPAHAMDPALLKRTGYDTLERLRNWRYYRKFSGGTMADLGSHQVDVLNWFLHARPKAVMAAGGADHIRGLEWYDNIMALYEWDYELDGKTTTVRGHYQACSTSGHGGYAETFMGPAGSITISEHTDLGCIRREPDAPESDWEKRLEHDKRALVAEAVRKAKASGEPGGSGRGGGKCNCMIGPSISATRVRHYPPVPRSDRPTTEHAPHLENFFAAVRDENVKLNCPAEVAYETAVSVLRANDAVAAGRRVMFAPEDFRV